MKFKKTLLFFILTFTIQSYAMMPSNRCESVCSIPQKLPEGSHCIQLNKNKVYYRTLGKGKPTMIFSSGTGFPANAWFEAKIADKMAAKIKVFSYDRIFTFNSCPNFNDYMPLTAKDIVVQLRHLLRQENINPPYILVGQSFGGLYMLLYAREFPKEVAGLVLMDATSDKGPTPLPIGSKQILKQLGNPQNTDPENPFYNEIIGQLPSYLQMQNAPPLPKDMPIIIMYATKHCLPLVWTKKLMCMTATQEAAHKEHQIELYNMSNVHKLMQIEGDHMSFFSADKHPAVIEALESILRMAQPRIKKLSG